MLELPPPTKFFRKLAILFHRRRNDRTPLSKSAAACEKLIRRCSEFLFGGAWVTKIEVREIGPEAGESFGADCPASIDRIPTHSFLVLQNVTIPELVNLS